MALTKNWNEENYFTSQSDQHQDNKLNTKTHEQFYYYKQMKTS